MHRVVREYRKIEIARMMLDAAIKIYLDGGDRFSVIHLAADAGEVIAGLMTRKRSGPASGPHDRTARETRGQDASTIYEERVEELLRRHHPSGRFHAGGWRRC
ncbi:hypothetical protein WL30_12755 [Burkholderia ubonensis]|nr:hypothetical protein WL30_12755 [Burkholderia ubonensis]